MSKVNKINRTIYFNQVTLELIDDVVGHGAVAYAADDSVRGFLESLIHNFIYRVLEPQCVPGQVVKVSMPYEKLCRIYLNYRRASRGEDGYKIYRRSADEKTHAGKIVAIYGPEDLPGE